MEKGVPGAQTEPFFELLHPNTIRAPPPPPPAMDPAPDAASPPPEPSPLHSITPSYDFHLNYSSKSTDSSNSGDGAAKLEDPAPSFYRGHPPSLSSVDNHNVYQGLTMNSVRGRDYGKPMEPNDACERVTMAAIDRTMKNFTDNLLCVLENVSGRISQLETTVQGLERSIGELEKYEQSNVRLMKLELLVQEVHTGMQLLHDKQKLNETLKNVQLADQKPAMGVVGQTPADGWQQPKVPNEEVSHVVYTEPSPQVVQQPTPQYPPQGHSHYPHAPPTLHAPSTSQMQAFTTPHIPLPTSTNVPSTLTTQQPYPSAQPYPPAPQHLPPQPSTQQALLPPPPPQHSMQMPSFHSQPPPQPPSQSSYKLPMETTGYSHQHHHPAPGSSNYLPEPPQYSSGTHGGPRQQPMSQEALHPSSQHMYEPPGRLPTASSMPPSYVQPTPKPAPPVSVYDPSSGAGYGTPPYRAAQPVPSAPSGGAASYPRLPTAQPLHHALPAVSGGPPATTRSPLDEVIEKVVAMGFSREQVRAVVRQLTENGQSVELNVVLDRLMNGGQSPQAPRGWFGRG